MVGLVGALFAAAITLVTPITRASSLTIPQPSPRAQTVVVRSSDNDLALEIDEQSGAVVSISVGTTTVPVSSSSLNLTVVGGDWTFLSSGPTTGGGYAFTHALTFAGGQHAATVRESFTPADEGGVEWALEINGSTPALWSPQEIKAELVLLAPLASMKSWSLWAPWTTPGCSSPCACALNSPLESVPASCFSGVASLAYGSAVSVPLASVVSTEMDVALTLSVDPSENLISLASPVMHVGPNDGNGTTTMLGVSFGSGFRVGSTATPPLRLAMHITGGFGCTRDVFGRYSRRHSEVFVPPNNNVHYRASGMGSYTGMQGPLTQLADGVPLLDTLRRTGYVVNWDATFWWPYIMMIAPTLRPSVPGVYDNATELWGSSFDKQPGFNNRLSRVHVHASYAIRDSYYANWSEANLTVLGYFNGWELGQEMNGPYPPVPSSCPTEPYDLWRNAPCFIHARLDAALCRDAAGHFQRGGWDGDTMLDPGTPLYRAFLVEMVRNHLDMEPHFMGLASDGIRACLNYGGDDGISCVMNAKGTCVPVQDGFTAWATLMAEVGPMLHSRDKIFSANTVNGPHVHLLKHVDLVITEENANDLATINTHAWLGVVKPVVMWTTGTDTSDGLGADYFFQRLLHRGLFPMPPMPSADHSLETGSPEVHAQYEAYGPLFAALRGRTWVLRPHAVSVRAIANRTPPSARRSGVDGDSTGAHVAHPRASVVPCDAKDPSQQWENSTFASGACPGALQSAVGGCLVVYNPGFTPTGCGAGAGGLSEIWVYPCPPPSPTPAAAVAPPPPPSPSPRYRTVGAPSEVTLGTRDCPMHENIRWEMVGTQLRSAVPESAPPHPIDWSLCLDRVATGPTSPLTLAKCAPNASTQQWRVVPVSAGHIKDGVGGGGSAGRFLLSSMDGKQCISAKQAPPPPPPPMPDLPPEVNLFEDRSGAQIVVVTSPGVLFNGSVVVNVSNAGASASVRATVVRPGDAAPTPLSTVKVVGNDLIITTSLTRGAALVRVEL